MPFTFCRVPQRVAWAGVGLLLTLTTVAWAAHELLHVEVKQTPVRSKPMALGRVTGQLAYGTQVQVVDARGDRWVKIKTSGAKPTEGWVLRSALTEKKLNLQAGGADAKLKASEEELAVAGRTFDQQIENAYRKDNPDKEKGFKRLDAIEKSDLYRVTEDQIRAFIESGQLKPKEALQ